MNDIEKKRQPADSFFAYIYLGIMRKAIEKSMTCYSYYRRKKIGVIKWNDL